MFKATENLPFCIRFTRPVGNLPYIPCHNLKTALYYCEREAAELLESGPWIQSGHEAAPFYVVAKN